MRMFRKDEGFTLVELMVVVLIIGILVAIAIPVFNAARANAWRRSCHANQRTIEGAAQSFQAERGTLPAAVADLTTPGPNGDVYIKVAPTCPRPGSSAAAGYTLNAAGDTVVACTGGTTTAPDHGHF